MVSRINFTPLPFILHPNYSFIPFLRWIKDNSFFHLPLFRSLVPSFFFRQSVYQIILFEKEKERERERETMKGRIESTKWIALKESPAEASITVIFARYLPFPIRDFTHTCATFHTQAVVQAAGAAPLNYSSCLLLHKIFNRPSSIQEI